MRFCLLNYNRFETFYRVFPLADSGETGNRQFDGAIDNLATIYEVVSLKVLNYLLFFGLTLIVIALREKMKVNI